MYDQDEDGFPSTSFLDKDSRSFSVDDDSTFDVVDLSTLSVTPSSSRSCLVSHKLHPYLDAELDSVLKPDNAALKISATNSDQDNRGKTFAQLDKRPRSDLNRSSSSIVSDESASTGDGLSRDGVSTFEQHKTRRDDTSSSRNSSLETTLDPDRASRSAWSAEVTRACRRAAISRFRLKKANRKVGHKKLIRYQSRKKIAEVRPRVNGRFCKTGG